MVSTPANNGGTIWEKSEVVIRCLLPIHAWFRDNKVEGGLKKKTRFSLNYSRDKFGIDAKRRKVMQW